MIDRETVYQALFALLTPLKESDAEPYGPFKTVSRETVEVQNVPPGEQPVLFMDEVMEEAEEPGQGLPIETWSVLLHVGVCSEKGTSAASLLNPLVDAVLTAVRPSPPDDIQDLGLPESIDRVRVKGAIIKNLGQNSKKAGARQAVAYVPVQIILATTGGS